MLTAIWEVIGDANRYVDAQAPWALAKTDPVRRDTVLWVLAETIRRVTLLVQPFMPESTAKILDQLAVAPGKRVYAAFDEELVSGTALPPPQALKASVSGASSAVGQRLVRSAGPVLPGGV